jgi:hypothetical protein
VEILERIYAEVSKIRFERWRDAIERAADGARRVRALHWLGLHCASPTLMNAGKANLIGEIKSLQPDFGFAPADGGRTRMGRVGKSNQATEDARCLLHGTGFQTERG